MARKTVKRKTAKAASQTRKITKREPSPSVLLKNVASFSNSNKALQKEIKVMSKIFGENQKVLVSMKGMIDTLTSTLEHIQKQSKQINIMDATPYMYVSAPNILYSAIWIVAILAIFTALKRKKEKLQEADELGV